jgi:hypothetical protein
MPETVKPNALGRCDLAVVRLGELFCRRALEPALGNAPLWDSGVGELVEELVAESSIPKEPLTVVEMARRAGLLKAKGGRR